MMTNVFNMLLLLGQIIKTLKTIQQKYHKLFFLLINIFGKK